MGISLYCHERFECKAGEAQKPECPDLVGINKAIEFAEKMEKIK